MNQTSPSLSHINTENVDVYNSRRLPARLTMVQVARLLGFQPYQLLFLLKSGHLRCLGAPPPNATKWFSAAYVLQLSATEDWLSQATKIVARTARRNSRSHLPAPNNLTKFRPPTKSGFTEFSDAIKGVFD